MAVADGHNGDVTIAAAILCVTLNTGHAMPVLGFGMGSSRTPDDLLATILHVIHLGYRHLDTTSLYGTERAVGAAVADAVLLDAVASRADLFVTSKLWIPDEHLAHVVPALRESLARLSLDYLDLFLVHWSVAAAKKDPADALSMGDLVLFDMEGVWRVMKECHCLYSKSGVPPPIFQERRAAAASELRALGRGIVAARVPLCVAMAAAL